MCRNIRVLHNFKPPTSQSEIRAAALQYVRKVSGLAKPKLKELELLEASAELIAKETKKLLKALPRHGEPRTREGEIEKARVRWAKREEQMFARLHRHPHSGHDHHPRPRLIEK
jgi:hypothetical protein